jgi:hypothetical protein
LQLALDGMKVAAQHAMYIGNDVYRHILKAYQDCVPDYMNHRSSRGTDQPVEIPAGDAGRRADGTSRAAAGVTCDLAKMI